MMKFCLNLKLNRQILIFLNSDASNKVQSLHVAKSKDEQYSQAPKKYHLVK